VIEIIFPTAEGRKRLSAPAIEKYPGGTSVVGRTPPTTRRTRASLRARQIEIQPSHPT